MEYFGICDASAAVALDAEHFIVGNDENEVLHIFRRDQANAVAEVDLSDYLDTGPGREADIEAATRVGDRIYWITSHGRDKKGEPAPSRQRFFATTVVGRTVERVAAPPCTGLLSAILVEPKFARLGLDAAARKPPKAAGGFNIEGLAATPDGDLLIGLRNPLPGGLAILLPLRNGPEVIDRQAPPAFGEAILLALDGLGIRSIEWVAGRYLIVAGPYDGGSDFALYLWSGAEGEDPRRLAIDLGDLNPEGVLVFPGSDRVMLISDDGKRLIDGKECKKRKNNRRFRSMLLTLP